MSEDQGLLERSKQEFERALQRNIKGLDYFASPAPVMGASAKDVLIDQGTLRLYHYRPLAAEIYRVPILLVMATTNRGYIFDLTPGQSLVEYLLERGFDVFMIDWEAPRADEKSLDLASYVLDFLPRCVAKVAQVSGETDVSIVGYCFGWFGFLVCSFLIASRRSFNATIAFCLSACGIVSGSFICAIFTPI